jgi:hypothetical protein
MIRAVLITVFLMFLFSGCENHAANEVIVYELNDSSWGYKIKLNDKVIIIQKQIPAIQGNKAFESKKDANRVGEHVLNSLLKNPKSFPSVTVDDLDSLQVEY